MSSPPRHQDTEKELQERFEQHAIRRVKLGTFDIDGVLRGKHVSVEKFWSAAEGELGFCDVIFGWDIGDVLYDNVKFTGWHTGYPDSAARIDLATFRVIPWEPGTAFFLLDLVDREGRPIPLGPRQVLRRVVEQAAALGYTAHFAAEYEFFLFRETPQTLRRKNFRNLRPLSPGMFGYSVVRASTNAEIVVPLQDQLAGFEVPLEGFHTETGPGVYEAAVAAAEGVTAGDRAALFKTAVKEIAARHGLVATFMAKWNADLPGSGGHLHQSLWAGKNLFYDGAGGMPALMRHYVAGLVANLPELTAMLCPTINSYKRLVPGVWAPINATWGVDNRTTAVRAIPGGTKSSRVEMRLSGADMNPYLAMAASLAAGLDGVERQLEPPEATVNAYETKAPSLPRNLAEATRLFRSSALARRAFGEEFVEHYAATREWEWRQQERAVTDWELGRYFEAV